MIFDELFEKIDIKTIKSISKQADDETNEYKIFLQFTDGTQIKISPLPDNSAIICEHINSNWS